MDPESIKKLLEELAKLIATEVIRPRAAPPDMVPVRGALLVQFLQSCPDEATKLLAATVDPELNYLFHVEQLHVLARKRQPAEGQTP